VDCDEIPPRLQDFCRNAVKPGKVWSFVRSVLCDMTSDHGHVLSAAMLELSACLEEAMSKVRRRRGSSSRCQRCSDIMILISGLVSRSTAPHARSLKRRVTRIRTARSFASSFSISYARNCSLCIREVAMATNHQHGTRVRARRLFEQLSASRLVRSVPYVNFAVR